MSSDGIVGLTGEDAIKLLTLRRVGAKMCSYSCENGSHRRQSC